MNNPFDRVLQLFDLPGSEEEEDEQDIPAKKIGKNAEQSRDMGEKSLRSGEYDDAVEHFKRAVGQGRSGGEALLDIGAAYETADLLPQAFYQYRKALKAHKNSDLHLGVSALYRRFGRLDEATGELRRAIEEEPENAYLYFRLAEVLRANGYRTAAHEALTGAIALKPDDAFFHYWNADLLIDTGRYEDAMKACQAAVELNPADEHVMLLASIALWGAGKKDESIRAARLASELTTDDGQVALVMLYHLLLAANQEIEALSLAAKVGKSDPYDQETALDLLRRVGLDKERKPHLS